MSTSIFETKCLQGIRAAHREHTTFTGELPFSLAPEGFVQTHIARKLAASARFVTLETGVVTLLRAADATLKGRPIRKGRIDLAVYWQNTKPRLVIEVKKVTGHDSISADVKRLRSVLNRGSFNSTIRDAIVVIYSESVHKATLERRLKGLASRSKYAKLTKSIGPFAYRTYPGPAFSEPQIRYWVAACFRVTT